MRLRTVRAASVLALALAIAALEEHSSPGATYGAHRYVVSADAEAAPQLMRKVHKGADAQVVEGQADKGAIIRSATGHRDSGAYKHRFVVSADAEPTNLLMRTLRKSSDAQVTDGQVDRGGIVLSATTDDLELTNRAQNIRASGSVDNMQGSNDAGGTEVHAMCNSLRFSELEECSSDRGQGTAHECTKTIEAVMMTTPCCDLCSLNEACFFWIREISDMTVGTNTYFGRQICWCDPSHEKYSCHAGQQSKKPSWHTMEPCNGNQFHHMSGANVFSSEQTGVKDYVTLPLPGGAEETEEDFDSQCCNECLNVDECEFWVRQPGTAQGTKCWLRRDPLDHTQEHEDCATPAHPTRECRGGWPVIGHTTSIASDVEPPPLLGTRRLWYGGHTTPIASDVEPPPLLGTRRLWQGDGKGMEGPVGPQGPDGERGLKGNMGRAGKKGHHGEQGSDGGGVHVVFLILVVFLNVAITLLVYYVGRKEVLDGKDVYSDIRQWCTGRRRQVPSRQSSSEFPPAQSFQITPELAAPVAAPVAAPGAARAAPNPDEGGG